MGQGRWSVIAGVLTGVAYLSLPVSCTPGPAEPDRAKQHRPDLPQEQLVSTSYAALVHMRIWEQVSHLRSLLISYREEHGSLPRTLHELEDGKFRGYKFSGALGSEFHRLADDRATLYRFVYQPDATDLVLIALPRDSKLALLTMALDVDMARKDRYLLAAQTGGRMPTGPLWTLWVERLQIIRHLPDPISSNPGQFAAFKGLWNLQEAQETYAYLHEGKYASSLAELTEDRPERFAPLSRDDAGLRWPGRGPGNFSATEDGYDLSFGIDEQGWWAEMSPKSLDLELACAEAAPALPEEPQLEPNQPAEPPSAGSVTPRPRTPPCYKFRAAQTQTLSFASLKGDGAWRPITELP